MANMYTFILTRKGIYGSIRANQRFTSVIKL